MSYLDTQSSDVVTYIDMLIETVRLLLFVAPWSTLKVFLTGICRGVLLLLSLDFVSFSGSFSILKPIPESCSLHFYTDQANRLLGLLGKGTICHLLSKVEVRKVTSLCLGKAKVSLRTAST